VAGAKEDEREMDQFVTDRFNPRHQGDQQNCEGALTSRFLMGERRKATFGLVSWYQVAFTYAYSPFGLALSAPCQ
jgi:hypothetical protein